MRALAYTNTFVYDAVGNRATPETAATVGYDTRDRLTFDGIATYTYDDNGNVLSKSEKRRTRGTSTIG